MKIEISEPVASLIKEYKSMINRELIEDIFEHSNMKIRERFVAQLIATSMAQSYKEQNNEN